MSMTYNDPEQLLLLNIDQVFNEHDSDRRLIALHALWTEDAEMFEADEVFVGWQAISDNVAKLLARLPAGTRFRPAGPALVNHEAALLRWTAGSDPERPAATGTDVGFVAGGKIRRLYVFLDARA